MQKNLEPRKAGLREVITKKIEGTGWGYGNFSKDWDIVVTRDGKDFNIIASIRDVAEVQEVCAKRQMVEELGIEKEWEGREKAIILAIEAQFLEGIMDWSNYKNNWSVRRNNDRETVETYLLKVKPFQISQEEIDKRLQEMMKPTEESMSDTEHVITLNTDDAKPLTEEQAKQFGMNLGK